MSNKPQNVTNLISGKPHHAKNPIGEVYVACRIIGFVSDWNCRILLFLGKSFTIHLRGSSKESVF